MNIDYHYGVVYVVARLGGMDAAHAQTVAHSCQYVDDATTPGILEFEEGQTYERFASAHKMMDYRNELKDDDKRVWSPFHFLPSGEGNSLEDKAVCKPDSQIARAMVKDAIILPLTDNKLHRLGITIHTYVDTWAHQGFAGIVSLHNLITFLNGDDHDEETWKGKIIEYLKAGNETAAAWGLDLLSRLGHGAALHFPDMPWATWHYINGHGTTIHRNNLPDFVAAADMACRAIQGFMEGDISYENRPGLPAAEKSTLERLLSTSRSHDEEERLMTFSNAVADGAFPSITEGIPAYIPKGNGSWKQQGTGILTDGDGFEKPVWSQTFEDSDYRKFHDAIKEHRFHVTQELLPRFGVRLA